MTLKIKKRIDLKENGENYRIVVVAVAICVCVIDIFKMVDLFYG